MPTPIINTQLDTLNTKVEGQTTALTAKLQALNELLEAKNHLDAHRNAALDLMAGDARAALVTDVAGVAQLCKNGEILEVMDYGDEIHPEWVDGTTHYNPPMNLCHESDELLEDGESIHGAFFEWDKTMPFGVPYDPPEAIYYFAGTEGTGTFHISIRLAYGNGWKTTKHIQFTLNVAPAEGDQLVINCATSSDTDPTNGRTWNLYAKGSTTSKDTGTTSDGTGGTNLGSTDSSDVGKASGRVNAPQRVVYGYNRWSQSFLRQYLNATAESGWYAAANPWDRPDATVIAKAGFLYGYGAEVYNYFKPIKVVTVACNADSNVEDVTYDRVFLSSLEQMYCVPQFAGKEGSYWEYYKRLLGRTTPAPTSATYARLIKYALNAPTSAQYCWRRSAYRYYAYYAWFVGSGGHVGTYTAYYASRCAPSVFISD